MAVQTRIQVRRGTLSEWNAAAAVAGQGILYQGEIGYETDTKRFKIGDGSTAWSSLAYASVLPSGFIAGSGISLTQGSNGSSLTISLSDPTIQLADITDLSSDARTFLSTPSSANLKTLVSDETGTGTLVFNNSPTISGTLSVYDSSGNYVQIDGLKIVGSSGNFTNGIFASNANLTTFNVSSSGSVGSDLLINGNLILNSGSVNLSSTELGYLDGIIAPGYTYASKALTVDSNKDVTGIRYFTADVITSTTALRNSGATADTIAAYSGSNKDLVSLPTGTYPNFTELSYVKGVTSGIQTQINSKASSGITVTAGSGLTGGGTLASNFTINVGAGDGISVSSDSIAVDNTVLRTSGGQTVGSGNVFSGTTFFHNVSVSSGISAGSGTFTGNLTVGGSGLLAANINDFNTAVRTNRLDQMAVPTADVSFNGYKLTSLATPTNDTDAATKAYVDAARSGLDVKQSVRVATTENISLSGTQTIDGVSVIAGDRVLVKNQDTGSQNGIYVVAAGSWSRSTDADTNAEVTAGMFTFVAEGSANADSGWVLTTNDTITVGVTSLAFAQFSGAGQITAGSGLAKSGNTIDIGTASSSRIVVNADTIDLAIVSPSSGTGSAGINFIQSFTVDNYGRVTAYNTADTRDATTTVKGIASFSSGNFTVTSGAVSISVIDGGSP